MSNRPEVLTIALERGRDTEQKAALTELAARLDLGGNMSALARWLADAFIAIPEETTLLLMALADRAEGGDAWDTLQLLRDLLPPITLSAQDVAASHVQTWLDKLRILQATGHPADLADIAAADPEGYAALVEVVRQSE